jgi:hypothetical protein
VLAIRSMNIDINRRMLPEPRFREHCSKKQSIKRRKQADDE